MFIKIIAILIIGGIVVGVPLLVGFLGSGLMRLLGLSYTSIWDLVIYFLCFFIIEFPLSFIVSNFPKVLFEFNFISERINLALQFILNILFAVLILSFLDILSKNIYAPIQSIIVFALFYTVLDYVFKDKD